MFDKTGKNLSPISAIFTRGIAHAFRDWVTYNEIRRYHLYTQPVVGSYGSWISVRAVSDRDIVFTLTVENLSRKVNFWLVQCNCISFCFSLGTFHPSQSSLHKTHLTALFTKPPAPYSPIHKTAGSLVTGRSLQNGKMSMGNRHTERPPDPVLYSSRLSGGFVNRAVSYWPFPEKLPVGTTPRGHSPIDGFTVGTVEWWNSTRQIMEWPGTVRLAALWIALWETMLSQAILFLFANPE